MSLLWSVVEGVAYSVVLLHFLYLSVYVLAARLPMFKKKPFKSDVSISSDQALRFLIVIPAYKEDGVILQTVRNALNQSYPTAQFHVAVISDSMQDSTNAALAALPITLLPVSFEVSSKALALRALMTQINDSYDFVVVLDSDNIVAPSFLTQVAEYGQQGLRFMQARRVAKRLESDMAIFDAITEAFNNTVFRKGHNCLGLPSALIGSGMVLDFNWFKANVHELKTFGEDKELEWLLLLQNKYVAYLEDVEVKDEKIETNRVYYNQRKRWISVQYEQFVGNYKKIPQLIKNRQWALLDKVTQWIMLPRVVLFGITVLILILNLIFTFSIDLKWFYLLLFEVATFFLGIPKRLLGKFLRVSWKVVPMAFVLMLLNLLLRGRVKTFQATPHQDS
ncbi:MAG TPA: glycosyltransferase family 2 protein [Bacteroidales bacterium]|nr:glycosyltransferase family 2 protein [Bacteroidales bacterium]